MGSALAKQPMGRPTKYDPQFCQGLIDHMGSGLSFESYAAVIGVNKDTLYEWVKRFLEFSESYKKGQAANLLFWEKTGMDGLYTPKGTVFNSSVWIFTMKNRHKWTDRQEIEMGHTIKPLKEEYSKLTDAELLKLEEADKKSEDKS